MPIFQRSERGSVTSTLQQFVAAAGHRPALRSFRDEIRPCKTIGKAAGRPADGISDRANDNDPEAYADYTRRSAKERERPVIVQHEQTQDGGGKDWKCPDCPATQQTHAGGEFCGRIHYCNAEKV